MDEKFTVEEFKNYLRTQDSLGDAFYHCVAENIRFVNQKEKQVKEDSEPSIEKCSYYVAGDTCCHPKKGFYCNGMCEFYEEDEQ